MDHSKKRHGVPWAMALAAVLALVVAAAASAAPGSEDTVVYHGAVVYTAEADTPAATWFAVSRGKVLAVGDGEPPADRWPDALWVDLDGRFVAPGFVDAHIHFVDGGLSLIQTDLAEITDADALRAALREAATAPIGGWLLARNLDVTALGGALPDHESMGPMLGDSPAYVALKGGHHVYVNPAGLDLLDIDADTPDPDGGHILHDDDGAPTGVLAEVAAWDALRAVYDRFGPDIITRAMLAGQDRALAYGITAMGDNTFFPDHAHLYARLARKGLWTIRVAARSYGPEPMTDFLMKPQGRALGGWDGPWVRYFGPKYFGDESLSPPALLDGDTAYEPGGEVHYSEDEFRRHLLFAGRYGAAFHVQGRTSVERLVAARTAVAHRRSRTKPDILDHCGSCSGDLIEPIRESGFRLTLLPGQLHELPVLVQAYGEENTRDILSFAELYDAGLEPALTSDWPYGSSVTHADLDFHRLSLAPLALIAVSVSGKTPDGDPIPGAEGRVITLEQAMQGFTRYGALAIGRDDVGRLAEGTRADFVVLDVNPFEVDPVELYRLDVHATFVDGAQVFPEPAAVVDVREVRGVHAPVFGRTPSPIVGFSPTHHVILGGAIFVYPFKARGTYFSTQIMAMTRHPGLHAETSLRLERVEPKLSVQTKLLFDNWRDNDYGVGMDAEVEDRLETRPQRFEAGGDVVLHPGDDFEVQLGGRYTWFRDGIEVAILERSRAAQPRVSGHYAGARVAAVYDNRDAIFSPRRGGWHELRAELWPMQASEAAPRVRIGADLRRYIPLRAPNVILALRLEGGASIGEPAYFTNYSLGGIYKLRGYYSFRFRGHHFALGVAELRFPIWFIFTGAVFGEVGRVWVDDLDTDRPLAATVGGGIRIALPKDLVKRLRFDVGFSPDQWGIFFGFDEAF